MRTPLCGCLIEAASLRMTDNFASLRLHYCGCLTESASMSSSLRLPHQGFLTVTAKLRLFYCGCLTVALYLNLHPNYVWCCLLLWFVLQNTPKSCYFEEPTGTILMSAPFISQGCAPTCLPWPTFRSARSAISPCCKYCQPVSSVRAPTGPA